MHPVSDSLLRRPLSSSGLVNVCWLPILFLAHGGLNAADPIDFDRDIAPLLAEHCLDCHKGAEPTGGLDLSDPAKFRKGGDSGTPVSDENWEESLIWQRVQSSEMPPKKPLAQKERDLIRRWLQTGAKWGDGPIDPMRYTTGTRAGYDWWSLQPISRPEVPAIPPSEQNWVRNEIDAFIIQRLQEAGLTHSPPADRRDLARRLSFDLVGLPPTPADLNEFLTDNSETGYLAYVDRLLGSIHYGERWARHWLDVARYGESQGFERDKIRPNSWPYRDWVIHALNSDLPYDEFARMQLAGDVLRPGDGQAVAATGFLVAGPYDEVGQQQQSEAMRAVVRQDEMEDIVGTVGQTFLGLTVNCARCHDHKFDPIQQVEYYQLVSALDGVRHGERPYRTPQMQKTIDQLTRRRSDLEGSIDAIEKPVIDAILHERSEGADLTSLPQPLARWTFDDDSQDQTGLLSLKLHGDARIDERHLVVDGKKAYATSVPLPVDVNEKTLTAWVSLADLDQRGGGVIGIQTLDGNVFDSIVFGEKQPRQWMAGSNNFERYQDFGGPDESTTEPVHLAIVYEADGTIRGYRNGEPYGKAYDSPGPFTYAKGKSQIVLGMRHGAGPGGNRMLAGAIDQAAIYDRALTAAQIAALARRLDYVSGDDLAARLSPEARKRRSDWKRELAGVRHSLSELEGATVYAVTPRQPEPTHLLVRGSTLTPAGVVTPGGIASLKGPPADFGLASDSPEGKRRIALADWITHRANPLFARVIVNRVWHYHFGQGIVESPNDFGYNGGRPSHPRLLDYLAARFLENGYSLKWLHRQIVTSATYRQSSRMRPDGMDADSGNRLLWRHEPLRLDAEQLRDALLSISGTLNPQAGGPSYQDFKTFVNNSQFYEVFDSTEPDCQRRTVYRTWLRSGRSPFLDVFDCPDPSTTAPKRAVTTTPLQSLSLLNNSFVLRMAEDCARRLLREAGDDPASQIDLLWQLSYGRPATPSEQTKLAPFVQQHGLEALCRAVWNSNEFLYIE